jgi:hypothetical protein
MLLLDVGLYKFPTNQFVRNLYMFVIRGNFDKFC